MYNNILRRRQFIIFVKYDLDIFIGPFYGDKGITGLGEKFTRKKKVLYRGEFIDGEKSDKGEENSNE